MQSGQAEQPQNGRPVRGPFLAMRCTMGRPQRGQAGLGEASDGLADSDLSDEFDLSDGLARLQVRAACKRSVKPPCARNV